MRICSTARRAGTPTISLIEIYRRYLPKRPSFSLGSSSIISEKIRSEFHSNGKLFTILILFYSVLHDTKDEQTCYCEILYFDKMDPCHSRLGWLWSYSILHCDSNQVQMLNLLLFLGPSPPAALICRKKQSTERFVHFKAGRYSKCGRLQRVRLGVRTGVPYSGAVSDGLLKMPISGVQFWIRRHDVK